MWEVDRITRQKRRSVDRGSVNSQIVAYTEGELRSNPGGARERHFVLSVAVEGRVGTLPGGPSGALTARSHQSRAEDVGKRCATYPANLCPFLFGAEFSDREEDLGDAVGQAVEDATFTAIGKRTAEHFQHVLCGLE